MKKIHILFYVLVVLLLSSCQLDDAIFEKSIAIKDSNWRYEDAVKFEVEIKDMSMYYDVVINLRHTGNYEFRNLWVWVETTYPSGKTQRKRVDLPIADHTGKWYGKGLGGVISHQVTIQDGASMPEVGVYTFVIEQDMRFNPLPNIMDVGLRIAPCDGCKEA